MKTVIVNVNLEYAFNVVTDEEAEQEVLEVELPSEYVEDSFEIVKVLDGNQTVSGKVSKNNQFSLGKLDRICYNSRMKIEQNILTIQDIAEHREFLRDEPDKQAVDDMLIRFAMTFTESEDA